MILTWCVRSHAWPCIFEFRVNNKIFETWFDENATWSELNRTAGDVLVGMREHLEHKGHTHLYGCASSACVTGRLRDAMVAQQRSGCAAGDSGFESFHTTVELARETVGLQDVVREGDLWSWFCGELLEMEMELLKGPE